MRPLRAQAVAELLETSFSFDADLSDDDGIADPSYNYAEEFDADQFQGFKSDFDELDRHFPSTNELPRLISQVRVEEEFDSPDDNSEPEEDDEAPLWSNYQNRSQKFPYTGTSGVQIDLLPTVKPFEVFGYLFDNTFFEYIDEKTNLFARQVTEKRNKSVVRTPKARHKQWTPTTVNKIKKFFGLILWMGMFRAPSIYDYWRNSKLYTKQRYHLKQ